VEKEYYIESKYELEYLTNFEADRQLREYFKKLETDGTFKVIVTNIDFYAKQWLEALWNEETLKDKTSTAQESFKAFWGEQINCDPWAKGYEQTYKTVKKSGYNSKRLVFLLKRIGFVNIEILEETNILMISASKALGSGERQDATQLENIRLDHRKRYEFANKYITKKDVIVTDGACGVGYGSYILAQNSNISKIQAIDISTYALEHGKKYFYNDKIQYIQLDLENDDLTMQKADYYVSFETIEHLPTPEKYIEKIAYNLKDDGIFIGSTPNETIMPYIKQNFLYHTRHFTVEDLREILMRYGFKHIEFFQQKREEPSDVVDIDDGQYIIFVAKKTKDICK